MMVRIFKHFVPVQILFLVLADGLILFGSMYLGVAARFFADKGGGLADILPVYPKALVYAVIMLATMTAAGLYLRDVVRSGWKHYLRYLGSFAAGSVIMTLVFYAVPELILGRGAFALTVMFSVAGSAIGRIVFLQLAGSNVLKKRIMMLGTGSRAMKVEDVLQQEDMKDKFQFIGYVPIDGAAHDVDNSKVVRGEGSLIAIVIRNHVDEIIVGVRDRRGGMLPMEELLECKLEGINVIDLSSFFERESGRIEIDSLNPSWMVFSDGFCRSSFRATVKRVFDVITGGMLLVMASPILACTAILIWMESGSPILYRQKRVGECGQIFDVLKFRSMRVDAEAEGKPQWAVAGDNRMTRVGRVIRKLRIDELPQIFNVLAGHMSFVGPRPERPFFVDKLTKEIPYYSSRHSVKPGITGWAQINYPYGASVEDARRKLQFDLYYAKNHSLFLDLVILLLTAEVVLFGRGAR